MARADFITSLVLMVLGAGVVVESWRMPRFTEFGNSIWSAPGVVPAMIGISLAIMGAVLFSRSRLASTGEPAPDNNPQAWRRVGLAFAFCIIFAVVLVGQIPFVLAAFLFILSFIVFFDLLDHRERLRDRSWVARRLLLALIIAGVAAFAIATVFEDVFFVRLP